MELDEGLVLASYVKISKYRWNVMGTLYENRFLMPSEIANRTGILNNHISFVLKQLKNKGLIECINPEVRKGRLYRLTDTGMEVMSVFIKEI